VALPDWKPESLLDIWRSSPCATFSGQLNTSHQMICVSADCCLEDSNQGWTGPPNLHNSRLADLYRTRLKLAMELSSNGSSNFAFCFDGRSREARKAMDEFLSNGEPFAELWFTYVGKLHTTHTRKVFASQHNQEVCYIKMPVPRVRISANERKDTLMV